MSKPCENKNAMRNRILQVKEGILGFSFLRVLLLMVVMTGFLQGVSAREKFSLLVGQETGLLRDARAVSVAPDGSIYIADTGNQRILRLNPNGDMLGEIGGLGNEHGQFQWPVDIAAEQGANIWVSDFGNRRIERFSRNFTWHGTIELPAIEGDVAAQPGALAVTAMGDLFVVDGDGQRLLKYNPLGMLQAEFGARKGMMWVSTVRNLAAHRDFGVVWADAEADLVRRTDVFGNSLGALGRGKLRIPQSVCFSEEALWISDSTGVYRSEIERGSFQLVLETQLMRQNGVGQISDFACQGDSVLYILDGSQGQLWKVTVHPE